MNTYRSWCALTGLFAQLFALTAFSAQDFARDLEGDLLPHRNPAPLYAAVESNEAAMSFSHWVEIAASRKPGERAAREKIEAQLVHLFGPMAAARVKAVPKGDHRIRLTSIDPSPDKPDTFVAKYVYAGTIVVGDSSSPTYTLLLPNNPDTIYASGIVRRGRSESFPCTDEHYTSEGDFWYFWNPARPGCPLKDGLHYRRVPARIKRYANTRVSYPEYDRLVDADREIKVTMLFGMDEQANDRNPLTSKDVNADNFRTMRRQLAKLGFQGRLWTASDLRALLPARTSPHPFVEEYVLDTPKARIVVRLFFGPSGISERSRAFHHFFKDSLENSAIMMYDGHSGLGGHLDIAAIEAGEGFRIQPSRDRYQIYFFNSCSSYTYYNTMFFERKKTAADPRGTKNLDILTNGLETYFEVMHDTNFALVRAVVDWAQGGKARSYQELAAEIDSDNLFGVNGDEDNR